MVRATVTFPSIVSWRWTVIDALEVSRLAGRYGNWLDCTKSSWDPGPLRFTMRAMTSPVTAEPSC
jgi:hypothetical protein